MRRLMAMLLAGLWAAASMPAHADDDFKALIAQDLCAKDAAGHQRIGDDLDCQCVADFEDKNLPPKVKETYLKLHRMERTGDKAADKAKAVEIIKAAGMEVGDYQDYLGYTMLAASKQCGKK